MHTEIVVHRLST